MQTEKQKAYVKAWQEKNKDKMKSYAKAWREKNKDKMKSYAKAWREKNPEYGKAKSKEWREKNPEHVSEYAKNWNDATMSTIEGHIYKIASVRKHEAKKKGIAFDVSLGYLANIMVDHCPILGIKLGWCKRSGKLQDDSPSLDRIIPSLGYVEGNVAWISNRANRIKNDSTADELRAIADYIDSQIA